MRRKQATSLPTRRFATTIVQRASQAVTLGSMSTVRVSVRVPWKKKSFDVVIMPAVNQEVYGLNLKNKTKTETCK